MSGGSWDYVYHRINEAGDRLCNEKDPLRRSLGKKVNELAEVMRTIEWVDSGDSSSPEDTDAIKAFLGGDVDREVLAVLTEDAKNLIKQLEEYSGQDQIKKEEI
jgi:hypothetical protein